MTEAILRERRLARGSQYVMILRNPGVEPVLKRVKIEMGDCCRLDNQSRQWSNGLD